MGFFIDSAAIFKKIIINLSKKDKTEIITKGMDIQPKIVLFVISMLKYIELKFLRISVLGSSLISIVKK